MRSSWRAAAARAARRTGGESPVRDAHRRRCLFDLSVGKVEDVRSAGVRGPGRLGAEAFSPDFQLALPYRGFFVWHVERDEMSGDANQALFITG